MTRFEYERILAAQALPEQVIATKRTAATAQWHDGASRNLLDDCWLIATEDANVRKDNTRLTLSFDSVIDVGGMTLADERSRQDNLSKKLVCLMAMMYGARRGPLSAERTFRLSLNFDWYVRWRRSRGMEWTSEIRPEHFDAFIECLGSGDILDLVPIMDRLDHLTDKARAGRFSFPISKTVGRSVRVDWTSLAGSLGVNYSALSRSANFRTELIGRLPILAPEYAADLAATTAIHQEGRGDKKRAADAVKGLLLPWVYLARLSKSGFLGHDPLSFDPFERGEIGVHAKRIGKDGNRTATLLPRDFFALLNAAAVWVTQYASHIIYAVEQTRCLTDVLYLDYRHYKRERELVLADFDRMAPSGLPLLAPDWSSRSHTEGRLSVGEAAKYLMTACAILIAGFGARRLRETTSLQTGCLTEDIPGLCELTIYIEKTLRDCDRIPVPHLVKAAVQVLEALTATTRAKTGNRWLFELMRMGRGERKNIPFVLHKTLPEFAALNGLALPDGWDSWAVKPHQLRRGFAVAYYHGFEASSLDALSRFLRHFLPEMTRVYVNEALPGAIGRLREEIAARTQVARGAMSAEDRQWLVDAKKLLDDLADRGAVFNEVRCEALVHRMLAMWDGVETPIGQGAKRLYGDLDGMVAKASAEVRIGSRSNHPEAIRQPLTSLLQDYAKTHYLEPVPGHAAHCVCRPGDADDLAQAACLRAKAGHRSPWQSGGPVHEDVRPDYAFSSVYVCLGCPHCAAFKADQHVLANTLERLEDAVDRGATPASRESAADKLARFKGAIAAAKAATKGRA
ncbi:hypothetical protein [Azospirillum sp. B506]|uniref:hypothetical protein n=1 Tax=Azospirillum sp. B506 TaxID=137721 RepID=UPI0011DE595A|nr:hypothetical protein [Azospirillum sp. B506]